MRRTFSLDMNDSFYQAGRRRGVRDGIEAVADLLTQYDKQVGQAMNGYRISDVVLCKFNLRKKPRKVKK